MFSNSLAWLCLQEYNGKKMPSNKSQNRKDACPRDSHIYIRGFGSGASMSKFVSVVCGWILFCKKFKAC